MKLILPDDVMEEEHSDILESGKLLSVDKRFPKVRCSCRERKG
jgi:hypothetical protein